MSFSKVMRAALAAILVACAAQADVRGVIGGGGGTALPSQTGNSGKVLSTNGSVLSWIVASGSGTVTQIQCGTGLSGGTITTTGVCALASQANNTILGNVSGSSGAPVALTVSQVQTLVTSSPLPALAVAAPTLIDNASQAADTNDAVFGGAYVTGGQTKYRLVIFPQASDTFYFRSQYPTAPGSSNTLSSGVQATIDATLSSTSVVPASIRPAFDRATYHGLLGWTAPPATINSGTGTALTSGVGNYWRVTTEVAGTVNKVLVPIGTIGVTCATTFVAVYDANGNLLSTSADQSTTFSGTTGIKSVAMSTPFAATANTTYFVFIVGTCTTMFALQRVGALTATATIGQTNAFGASAYNAFTLGTTVTAAPATFAISGSTASTNQVLVALSS